MTEINDRVFREGVLGEGATACSRENLARRFRMKPLVIDAVQLTDAVFEAEHPSHRDAFRW